MLTETQYQAAAKAIGVNTEAIKAFATVESSGNGFQSDGQVKILFERHWFYKLLRAEKGQQFADQTASKFPDICNPSPGGYGKYSEQHGRLDRAVAIDRQCALQAASWGAFQIMGYHWKTCGYESLQAFINDMYTDAGQLNALVGFLKANPAIIRAIKAKDWATVAKLYNGPGYAVNKYDTKLAAAYAQFGGV